MYFMYLIKQTKINTCSQNVDFTLEEKLSLITDYNSINKNKEYLLHTCIYVQCNGSNLQIPCNLAKLGLSSSRIRK